MGNVFWKDIGKSSILWGREVEDGCKIEEVGRNCIGYEGL
jgi:hypothetical protein